MSNVVREDDIYENKINRQNIDLLSFCNYNKFVKNRIKTKNTEIQIIINLSFNLKNRENIFQ